MKPRLFGLGLVALGVTTILISDSEGTGAFAILIGTLFVIGALRPHARYSQRRRRATR